ncbi:MAG: hypothetical protein E6J19_08580 [Chloroflexi bacterium]|nr:MAG: hypothetical protein E6J19_08580 [Chloroflexota bacterium]
MSYPIAVLVSGRGTNLQAILDACASGAIDASVVFVASNRAGVPALVRADRAGVPHGAFTTDEYKTRAATHGAMADALVAAGARLVVCAGFDHILAREGEGVRRHGAPRAPRHRRPRRGRRAAPRAGERGRRRRDALRACAGSGTRGDRRGGATLHRERGRQLVERRGTNATFVPFVV